MKPFDAQWAWSSTYIGKPQRNLKGQENLRKP